MKLAVEAGGYHTAAEALFGADQVIWPAGVAQVHHGMQLNLQFPCPVHHGNRRFACIP